MIRATWKERDFDIVETLCCRVRVLSLEQVTHGWWQSNDDLARAERRMTHLVHAGLLRSVAWNVKLPRFNNAPLLMWNPTSPVPDFEHLAGLVRNRWPRQSRLVQAYIATPKAARLFGSSAGNTPPIHHRNHDLLLGAVFVQYRTNRPDEACRWLGEDALPMAERGVKNPDAFLLDEIGQVCRVIESAGRYSQDQIETFHHYCQQIELPYELW